MSAETVVKDYMRQLEGIKTAEDEYKAKIKDLSTQRKDILEKVREYLARTGEPAITYGEITVFAVEKKMREKKAKKEKMKEAEDILSQYGLRDTKETLDKIMEALKGEQVITQGVKLSKNATAKKKAAA
jgi:hypothetical protein